MSLAAIIMNLTPVTPIPPAPTPGGIINQGPVLGGPSEGVEHDPRFDEVAVAWVETAEMEGGMATAGTRVALGTAKSTVRVATAEMASHTEGDDE